MIQYAKTDATDVEDFMNDVVDNRLSEDDLVIQLLPKEMEMKPDPRRFAVLTPRARKCNVIKQYIVKETFLPAFKEVAVLFRKRITKEDG